MFNWFVELFNNYLWTFFKCLYLLSENFIKYILIIFFSSARLFPDPLLSPPWTSCSFSLLKNKINKQQKQQQNTVCLVLASTPGHEGLSWSMIYIPSIIPSEKTYFLSSSGYWLWIASSIVVRFHAHTSLFCAEICLIGACAVQVMCMLLVSVNSHVYSPHSVRKCCFLGVIHHLWFLWSLHLPFYIDLWTLRGVVCCSHPI